MGGRARDANGAYLDGRALMDSARDARKEPTGAGPISYGGAKYAAPLRLSNRAHEEGTALAKS